MIILITLVMASSNYDPHPNHDPHHNNDPRHNPSDGEQHLTNECWVTWTLLISTAHQDRDDHPFLIIVIVILVVLTKSPPSPH